MSDALRGLPDTIGRYEVRDLLGRGGMGRVIRGWDPTLRREVAIKLVEPTAVEIEDLAELRFMFHREARATAALRHTNIVEVFDYSGPEAELMYLACELVEGPTVREVIDERGPCGPALAAALGYELTQALAVAHEQGIVHRDIKLENVFWTRAGRVVLADFGIAKAFDGTDKLGGTIQYGHTNLYGSPAYMAPEQLTGGEVGTHTDLYALGTLLYEALTGEQAFDGPDIQSILDAVVDGEHVSLAVGGAPALPRLIEQLMSKDPSHRPSSAAELSRELRGILDDHGVTDPRLMLQDHGEQTAAMAIPASAGDDDDDRTEMFASPEESVIRAEVQPNRLATLATRGPFIFGMIAVAIGMGAGGVLLLRIGKLPEPGEYLPVVTQSREAPTAPTVEKGSEVMVLLRFAGLSTVRVDGREVGSWHDEVRLALPPGPHRVEASGEAGTKGLDILLIKGTTPTFDLMP